MKNSSDTIRYQTHNLPACTTVPQPTVIPHAPKELLPHIFISGIKIPANVSNYEADRIKNICSNSVAHKAEMSIEAASEIPVIF